MPSRTPSPVDVYVGSQIRLHRKLVGMSQTALARSLGITFQQIQKYEKGTNRVGASRVQGIASILGVQVNVLFPSSHPGSADEAHTGGEGLSLEAFATSSEGFALNRAFMRIQDINVRRRVVALVRALAEEQEIRSAS